MKKTFKFFAIPWIVGLALFNVITFVIPRDVFGYDRYESPLFWVSYGFIMLAFIGQIVVSYLFSSQDTKEKMFLRLPLLHTGYIALGVTVAVGALFMAFPVLPDWLGAIICVAITCYFIVASALAGTAAEAVEAVEEKVKAKTQFIKLATVDAEGILNRAESPEAKAEAKTVYEAIRYSDPMSSDALAGIEAEIDAKLNAYKANINTPESAAIAKELLLLIKDRNAKCKALK